MKITFVFPFAGVGGGARVVGTYALRMRERGHHVTVVSQPPKRPHFKGILKEILVRRRIPRWTAQEASSIRALGDDHVRLSHSGAPRPQDVPDADVILATWWETVEWIMPLPATKGIKAQLVQDYEMFPYLPVDRVRATLECPLKRIAVSRYIAHSLQENHGILDTMVIPNGVDTDQFTAKDRQKNPTPRFGFLYASSPRKNIARAIEALEIAKSHNSQIQAVAFAAKPPDPDIRVPDWIEYHVNPDQSKIPNIYASCDAWLFSSDAEGFGLPILEAMACRTPVIATPAGAAPDLITNENGLLVPHDTAAMADAISTVAEMAGPDWKRMSDAAYQAAQEHSWSAATDRLEEHLLEICARDRNHE